MIPRAGGRSRSAAPRVVVNVMSTLLIIYTVAFMVQVACGSMANRDLANNPIPTSLMKAVPCLAWPG